MKKQVRPDTLVGTSDWVTIAVAAEMGGFDVDQSIDTVEEMLAQGIVHWSGDENRVVFLQRTEDGEVIH